MAWAIRLIVAIVVGTAGLAVGWAIATATDNPSGTGLVASADGAPIYDCPNGTVVGHFERESRVYVVARSEPTGWYEIRDLDRPSQRVWLSQADLALDGNAQPLAVGSCAGRVTAGRADGTDDSSTSTTAGATTTTTDASTTTTSSTTTTAPPTTTTTTSTTTTAPPTTTTTTSTTTTAPPTTTTQPDTTPPSIGNTTATPGEIWELDTDGISCGNSPRESEIAAFVTDAESGVDRVRATWTIGGDAEGITLSRAGNNYTGDFGPFDYLTVDDNTEELVTIRIRAVDNAGNASTTEVAVRVHSTSQCFG